MKTSRLARFVSALVIPVASSLAADSQMAIQPAYKLRSGDKVSVTVFQEEKLRVRNASIGSNGDLLVAGIAVPVRVAGLTVSEAESFVASAYSTKGVLTNPRVSIAVEAYASRK